MAAKDCPMCGEAMRLREREVVDRIPGVSQSKVTQFREWICPECDYFEEEDEDGGEATENGRAG
jgi:predicted RNA-binding Zn-ribbon protein involved in translation (DUF1610 family)